MTAEAAELWRRARSLPKNSLVALQLLDRAVRLAESAADLGLEFDLRLAFCTRCYHVDAWDRFFVHFAWVIARHDEDPERFPARRFLWKYKWALENACSAPAVSAERIEALFDDYERRMLRAGYSLRPLHQHKIYWARARGDLDGIERHLRAWRSARRDSMADCLVCELDRQGAALAAIGRIDEALDRWLELLHHKKRCLEVPAVTRSRLLSPLLRRGERRRASAFHRRGYKDVRELYALDALARHLAYETARGGRDQMLAMLERHLPLAVSHPLHGDRWRFYRAAAFALDHFVSKGYRTLALRLPDAIPVPTDGGRVESEQLRVWLHERCAEISTAFDKRHGNTAWTDMNRRFEERWESSR